MMIEEQLAFYNNLYDQPWARLSPYFFGIFMGYILHQAEEKLEMNILIMTCGKTNTVLTQNFFFQNLFVLFIS